MVLKQNYSGILILSLLALGLLLFGCAQPQPPADEVTPVIDDEWPQVAPPENVVSPAAPAVNLKKACDLLTAEEVAEVCGYDTLTAEENHNTRSSDETKCNFKNNLSTVLTLDLSYEGTYINPTSAEADKGIRVNLGDIAYYFPETAVNRFTLYIGKDLDTHSNIKYKKGITLFGHGLRYQCKTKEELTSLGQIALGRLG